MGEHASGIGLGKTVSELITSRVIEVDTVLDDYMNVYVGPTWEDGERMPGEQVAVCSVQRGWEDGSPWKAYWHICTVGTGRPIGDTDAGYASRDEAVIAVVRHFAPQLAEAGISTSVV